MRDSGLSGAVVDAQATLHGVFAFAREYGYVDANPMADMSYVVKPRKGDRALDLDELATVWLAAEHLSVPTCAAVRLLMLLGQRFGEVDEMRRSELIEARDLDHRLVSAD